MSDSLQPDTPPTGDTEEVDAVVVLPDSQSPVLATNVRAVVPAVQAAAVAATGFVAGAAVVGLAHRRQRRRDVARSKRRLRGGAGELVQIVGSRSLLVDVHLLGGRR
ncbi:MAG TPA: hypothetical protein VNV42_09780 [Solirubrobacteraceae bacterium]|nr:hypothetical protein [Solirubrobacteraceae bacterium]